MTLPNNANASGELAFDPNGKVAVVTGAAGGIGLGMARAFTSAGMSVVLSDLDANRVEVAAAALRADGHNAIGIATDVTKFDDVQELADAAMDTYGKVDVLCNNAGAAVFAKLYNVTMDDWQWTLDVCLMGPIHGVKVFQPLVQQSETGGHINTTSSVAGLIAGAAAGPYNVAKSGVIALMATLEREFRIQKGPHRASVLCPGPINTEISRNSVRNRKASKGEVSEGGDAAKKMGDKIGNFLSNGMDPDEVGHIVLEGMMQGKFWIFTHPKLLKLYREQNEMMDENGMLSMGKLT